VARIANADLQSVGVDGEPLPAEPQPGLL